MIEKINGFTTDRQVGHLHYWILHKEGYRFCSCGAKKIGDKVIK